MDVEMKGRKGFEAGVIDNSSRCFKIEELAGIDGSGEASTEHNDIEHNSFAQPRTKTTMDGFAT
jgi:hypothetical protein